MKGSYRVITNKTNKRVKRPHSNTLKTYRESSIINKLHKQTDKNFKDIIKTFVIKILTSNTFWQAVTAVGTATSLLLK